MAGPASLWPPPRRTARVRIPDTVNDTVDTVDDTVGFANEPVLKKILDLMRNNPEITIDEMASAASVSRSTVLRSVKKLRENGMVNRIGGDRYGHWQMNMKDNEG